MYWCSLFISCNNFHDTCGNFELIKCWRGFLVTEKCIFCQNLRYSTNFLTRRVLIILCQVLFWYCQNIYVSMLFFYCYILVKYLFYMLYIYILHTSFNKIQPEPKLIRSAKPESTLLTFLGWRSGCPGEILQFFHMTFFFVILHESFL